MNVTYSVISHRTAVGTPKASPRSIASQKDEPRGSMNQGRIAGAGIAAHLHQHVVPRWGGDSNFLPVIGHTKTVPQLLSETRALLAKAWSINGGVT